MSQTSDVVWVEGPPGDSDSTAWNSLTYKVGDASGDFIKPVWTIEYGNDRQYQIELAEGHGNGGLMVSTWGKSLNPATELLAQRHAQFVTSRLNRHLFVDRTRVADTALVYSIPTLMWRRFSSLIVGDAFGPSGFDFYPFFSGVARIFEDEHVPYEVIILGHPDVSNDWAQIARFGKYRRLVVAGVDAMSDVHIANITTYVKSGGKLVIIGDDVATQDEELVPRRNGSGFKLLVANASKGVVVNVSSAVMHAYASAGGKAAAAPILVLASVRMSSRCGDVMATSRVAA